MALVLLASCEPGTREGGVAFPDTVSPVWREVLPTLAGAESPPFPDPADRAGWAELRARREESSRALVDAVLARYGPTVTSRRVAGVPVLDVRPRTQRTGDSRVLVYLHGGGYVVGSARSSLPVSAPVADATGLRVLAVDYTLAPEAQWRAVVQEVVSVLAALPGEGHPMARVGVVGDSAGGGLAAGAVLALRDAGRELPAALVLFSPWADVTETGDSYVTLREAEPVYRYDRHLGRAALAYAPAVEQKHPHVSPVYGDFAQGFPPTLIQGGTRELFLSNFVRLYQAIDAAGGSATLDLYEGMPHDFQVLLPDSPESRRALAKTRRFLDEHLGE